MFSNTSKKTVLFSLVALGLGLSLIGCSGEKSDTPSSVGQTYKRKIQVVNPQEHPLYRSAPGQIISKQQSQISSRMMGYITQMNVSEGDRVVKGQVLATIDPVDIQGQVEIANASKEQAQAALEDAKADFERFDRLFKENAVTQAQCEKMKLNFEIAEQRAIQAQSGLKIANSQTKYTTVRSPIDGVVSRKMLREGDLASPGYPFLTIENPGQLEIITQVPEALYKDIKKDQKVCYYLEAEKICDLEISHSVPVADPMSHTHLIKLNPSKNSKHPLHPGGFIEVHFAAGSEEVISLESSNIINRSGLKGVFVLNNNNQAQFRMVRTESPLGEELHKISRIQSGLKAGDRVVVGDLSQIQNSDKIEVVEEIAKVEASHE